MSFRPLPSNRPQDNPKLKDLYKKRRKKKVDYYIPPSPFDVKPDGPPSPAFAAPTYRKRTKKTKGAFLEPRSDFGPVPRPLSKRDEAEIARSAKAEVEDKIKHDRERQQLHEDHFRASTAPPVTTYFKNLPYGAPSDFGKYTTPEEQELLTASPTKRRQLMDERRAASGRKGAAKDSGPEVQSRYLDPPAKKPPRRLPGPMSYAMPPSQFAIDVNASHWAHPPTPPVKEKFVTPGPDYFKDHPFGAPSTFDKPARQSPAAYDSKSKRLTFQNVETPSPGPKYSIRNVIDQPSDNGILSRGAPKEREFPAYRDSALVPHEVKKAAKAAYGEDYRVMNPARKKKLRIPLGPPKLTASRRDRGPPPKKAPAKRKSRPRPKPKTDDGDATATATATAAAATAEEATSSAKASSPSASSVGSEAAGSGDGSGDGSTKGGASSSAVTSSAVSPSGGTRTSGGGGSSYGTGSGSGSSSSSSSSGGGSSAPS